MAITIAVAGKGGTGKTTISALLVQHLAQKGVVLAVDADPSTNLSHALGIELVETLGTVREKAYREVERGAFGPGVDKLDFFDRRLREILVESKSFDLLAMGRPEGPGCYCAVNNMIRSIIDQLAGNYDYVVVDCEAGMEHISRRTAREIDFLIVISVPTIRSLSTAISIKELISQLRTHTGNVSLVINRVMKEIPQDFLRLIERQKFDDLVQIAEDDELYDLELKGRPVIEVSKDGPLRMGIENLGSLIGKYERARQEEEAVG